ncbi:MAG: family oxidoreductase [Sphingomonas bacterium]|nr:family oxidoreductase [Sphingomonas bacterium]
MSRGPLTLAGRTAVVTGAGSGIGRALAIEAAARGMRVAICDVNATGLAETAAACGALVKVLDVSDEAALASFAAEVGRSLPPVALVFANAGILRQGSMTTMPPSLLAQLLRINVVGTVATVQAFLPALRAAAPAQIVITASTGTMTSYGNIAGYCATKHALWPIAEGLREDLAEAGIGVSMLMPGAVTTGIFDASEPDHQPAPDTISPEDTARIAFAGAIEDRPLILTHPHFVERARARFEAALAELARSD